MCVLILDPDSILSHFVHFFFASTTGLCIMLLCLSRRLSVRYLDGKIVFSAFRKDDEVDNIPERTC